MIQRKQSLFLLGSMAVCIMMFFLPIGQIESGVEMTYKVCGFYTMENAEPIRVNYLLSALLSLIVLLQFISVFLFKNRIRQAMLVQVSLIALVLFVVLALLIQDMFSIKVNGIVVEEKITFTYNVIFIGISWVFSYLALRSIKKDEALIRSVNRMR